MWYVGGGGGDGSADAESHACAVSLHLFSLRDPPRLRLRHRRHRSRHTGRRRISPISAISGGPCGWERVGGGLVSSDLKNISSDVVLTRTVSSHPAGTGIDRSVPV